MITFGSPNQKDDDLFTEGMIGDALKAAADIDPDEIKQDWDNIDNDGKGDETYRKAKTLNDKGIGKAADELGAIDREIRKNKVDTRSIIARARNSVLQFPIYVTQTLRVNEAQIIAKLFERVYTTLVQTVLAQNPILDEDQANNLVFLKQFHSNLKESGDLLVNAYYEPIDDLDRMMGESVFFSEQLTPSCSVEFRWVPPTTNMDLIKENSRLLNEPLTGFSYLKEADDDKERREVVKEISNKYVTVSEDELRDMAMERAGLTDRERKAVEMSIKDIEAELNAAMANYKDKDQRVKDQLQKRLREKSNAEKKVNDALRDLKQDIKDGKVNNYSYENGRFRRYEKSGKTTDRPAGPRKADDIIKAVDAPKLLRDADIKKINGMLPYTIEATFRLKSRTGQLDREVHFIIGIKSVMHLIRTQDLADDLRELVTGNIKSLQKVRYKTGEIGFMDYMFNKSQIKADAAKHINYNKRWINTLKRLGEYDKMHGTLLKKPVQAITNGNVPIPNGTLILAQTDVTTLTNQTGIDLSVVSNAKRLAKTLFLIGIVIVDSSAGTMRVLFPDSDSSWDVQSLASIDAELAKTDNSQIMRELNRMVNR